MIIRYCKIMRTRLATRPSCLVTDHSMAVFLLWIILVIYVLCLSCFLVCSLWSCGSLPGKDWSLGSLVCDVLLCFVTYPCGVLGQVWYLIVSIQGICLLSHFNCNLKG